METKSQGTMPPNQGLDILPQVHNQWQQQQQQSQNPQQYLYQKQIQQQILLQKLHQQQQQLMPQIQSQPAQLQRQQQNPLQRDMQQRLQASGPLLHPQKQLYQSQMPIPETSSTSLDSTALAGQSSGGDWQEEVYQKIKSMKECYLPELNEMHYEVTTKLEQHDSLPQQPKPDQLEKLKVFKMMLDRIIALLQVSKSNISPNITEKLGLYEKQIINFININRPGNPLQSGQLLPPHMYSMLLSKLQVTEVQSYENQINFQLQTTNMQDSAAMLQQNMASMTLFDASIAQPSTMNSMQPSTNLDSDQEMLLTPCNRFQ